jgi:hypothetical protein
VPNSNHCMERLRGHIFGEPRRVDDLDKSASIDPSTTPRRSTSSLDDVVQSSEPRWFWVPGIFGSLLFASSFLRWLPAAIVHADKPYGLGQVVVGDFRLAWYSLLRCAVAYVVTAIALDYLPPIRWRSVFAIAAAALGMEIPAEIVSSALFGVHAGTWAPLIAPRSRTRRLA